jgi:predicted membrane protein
MLFTDVQFAIVVSLVLFALFFIVGYYSEKRSGGFFMLLSGFVFLGFDVLASPLLSVYVSALLSPFGIFIILVGFRKALYKPEKEKTKSEGQ